MGRGVAKTRGREDEKKPRAADPGTVTEALPSDALLLVTGTVSRATPREGDLQLLKAPAIHRAAPAARPAVLIQPRALQHRPLLAASIAGDLDADRNRVCRILDLRTGTRLRRGRLIRGAGSSMTPVSRRTVSASWSRSSETLV
jgi:hypothetical protein